MINLSTQAKLRLQENQKVLFKADFTLNKQYGRNASIPSAVMTLHGDDVMSGSATITDATSSSGSFDVGSAIIGSLDITLNNFDDRFSLYDFTGATMKVYLGVPLVDNVTNESDTSQVEWVVKGFYTVDKPTSIGNTIPLTMLDNMSKFEVDFSKVKNIGANASINTYLTEICKTCGVRVGTNVPHPEWTISKRPDGDNLTCLNIISYIAQINGCYARMNTEGVLTFGWYDPSQFKVGSTTNYDGGTFLTNTTPYSDGVNLEGGSFDGSSKSYTDEEGVARVRYANPSTDYEGGSFTWGNYHTVRAFQSFSVGTDLITITGIEFNIASKEENSSDNLVYLYDKNGLISDTETTRKENAMEYCLSISDNKLMPYLNQQATCLSYIASKVCGVSFTPFNITTLSSPVYEAGDCILVESVKGDVYEGYITSISYPLNGYITLNCDAESTNEKNSSQNNLLSTAIADVKEDTNKKINYYDEAVHNLNQLSANALGFYSTTVVQTDGSKIEYYHDKSTLETSLNAYKMSSTGFFIGNRAKTTNEWSWIGGVDMSANAVYKTLIADGIDANKINVTNLKAGNITSGTIDASKITVTNIDGANINATSISGGKIKTGTITATNISASTITGDKIASNTISASNIKTSELVVGSNITMGADAYIGWSKVGTSSDSKPSDFITNTNKGTYITKDYIETLSIKAGSVDASNINAGTITACQFGDGNSSSTTKINIKASSNVGLTFGDNLGWPSALSVIATENSLSDSCKGTICVCSKDITRGTDERDGLFMNLEEINYYCKSKTSNMYNCIEFKDGKIRSSDKSKDDGNAWHFDNVSDIRLKENIKDISISKIRNLFKGLIYKTFNYLGGKNLNYGLIAQNVKEVFENNDIPTHNIVFTDEKGYYSLSYENISHYCIPAVKDLYEICEKQQEEIDLLKQEIELLKQNK